MARKHQPVRPSRGKGGGFLRGLVIGLAVAAGVQVHHAGLPDWLDGTDEESVEESDRIEPPKTNFDFYRLLPRTEVRIDDSDLAGGDPPPAERTAALPSNAAGREPASIPDTRPSGAREYRVQVGSFRQKREADRLRASLALGGFESSIQTADTTDGIWHRVMLGPFRGREAAEAARARVLTARGIDARIVPGES